MDENVRIIVTVPKSVREDAKKRADTLGLSMSALVRMLVIEELEKNKKIKKNKKK